MAESLDYSKPSRDPSSSPTPVAAVPDNVSISSLLVLDIPVESDEDDVRRSLEEVPCVSPGGVSRVKVVSSDEKRKYATATIHHHTGNIREVEIAVGIKKPAIQMFTEECTAVFNISQPLFTDAMVNDLALQARKLGLTIDIQLPTCSVRVCGSCIDISKYRHYLSTLTVHSVLHLPELTNQIVDQSGPHGLENPTPSNDTSVFSNFSPDVLLLMPKIKPIPGVKFYPDKGSVEFIADNPEEREGMISAFQEAYQRIIQNTQFKSGTVEVPPSFDDEKVEALLVKYNERYDNCILSYDVPSRTVKVIALSSRQYDNAKKLFKKEMKGEQPLHDVGKVDIHQVKLVNGRCLTIKRGNMIEEEADVIVNAANSQLRHYGGLAKVLDEASNGALQRHSDILMSNQRVIPTGEAVITAAGGKLKCGYVVHAVGPMASEFKDINVCSQLIYNAVSCSLKQAQGVNASSIVLPALSTGVYSVDPVVSAQATFHAIETFNYNGECLKDIRIVILDQPTYDCFVKVITALANEVPKVLKRSLSDEPSSTTGDHSPPAHASLSSVTYPSLPSTSVPVIRTTSTSHGGATPTLLKPATITNNKPILPSTTSSNTSSSTNTAKADECPICLSKITKPKALKCCKQKFCIACIDEALQHSALCPMCQTPQWPLKGNQPVGSMRSEVSYYPNLPGFAKCHTIKIHYYFPNGIQGDNHPSPGKPYTGTTRIAYLPDNNEGRHVLKLLKKAFDAGLVFTIGTSVTTGTPNTVTWNDIHHKTNTHGGSTGFGYPDDTYLKRVKDELKAKGIH